MNLYDMEHTAEGYCLSLTASTLADLTCLSESYLYGVFGPGEIGRLTIDHDNDYSWDDVVGCTEAMQHALLVEPTRDWVISHVIDTSNAAHVRIAAAMDRWYTTYDDDHAERLVYRYAAMLGYVAESHVLYGTSPGDAIGVITLTPNGEDNYLIDTFRSYWAGEVYGYTITIESPLLDVPDEEESCWGFFGDDHVMQEVSDVAQAMVRRIIGQVRAVRQSA